jgi:hypothetical protein
MRYLVSYQISDESGDFKHTRYYNALNESTAMEMFEATCEESLVGEDPHILEIKEVAEEDSA